MTSKRITLGSNFYPATGDEERRMQAARDSWRALPGVDLVDVQFVHQPARLSIPGFRRVEALSQDSVRLTGAAGKRKPIMSELFDVLAREALAAGNELFAFANADIVLPPAMVETALACAAEGSKGQAFSRTDFDRETGAHLEMIYPGQDVFVLDANWWLENRWRFRPYIVGEVGWDNVYTSIVACHARGARLHNRSALVLHERHASWWDDSPFAPHNVFLITLDSHYFRDWCDYRLRIDALRPDRVIGPEPAELAAQAGAFNTRPTWRARFIHAARVLRAWVRLWWAGIRRGNWAFPRPRSAYPPATNAT